MSDEEYEYIFNVAEALGCTHTTLELPTDAAQLKRLGDFAMKKKIYAAYHTHAQGSMTAFDQAFALSKGNMANVDFGHCVAAGNVGGTPMQFLEKFHDRISSFHLKDRTTPEQLRAQPAVGHGRDARSRTILLLVKKNKWTFPASVELEYDHSRRIGRREGSQEVRRVLPGGAHELMPSYTFRVNGRRTIVESWMPTSRSSTCCVTSSGCTPRSSAAASDSAARAWCSSTARPRRPASRRSGRWQAVR